MGKYIGYIGTTRITEKDSQDKTYYNFRPFAEVQRDALRWLTSQERKDLQPDTKWSDIHLNYFPDRWDHKKQIDELLDKDLLFLFDFDNMPGTEEGRLPRRVHAADMIDSGRLRPLHEAEEFRLLSGDGLEQIRQAYADLQEKSAKAQAEVNRLEGEIKEKSDQIESQDRTIADFMERFQKEFLDASRDKMLSIAFDGFLSSKMLSAAAEWEAEKAERADGALAAAIDKVESSSLEPDALVKYLCETVQCLRPDYGQNVIVNIAICLTQGLLTVFSGEPGGGKTSICNIFAAALGLNKIGAAAGLTGADADRAKRYVAVSVERGWTSKRDLVGYYNPLSKTFDRSSRGIYDALRQLDAEKRAGKCVLPYLILLDEANLSPMEYYWSDFMNICDDLDDNSSVNLGEDYVYAIPETLHFAATINNDHTTEQLSPRLIDRAWIVTLPKLDKVTRPGVSRKEWEAEKCQIISWASLREAFIPKEAECEFTAEIQKIYDKIVAHLQKARLGVSPRIEGAIKRYWAAASQRFVEKDGVQPGVIALDYAVAQRILPKIDSNIDNFNAWLNAFKDICETHSLRESERLLKDIIAHGEQQMDYYQFFY